MAAIIGFAISKTNGRPLRLPFAIGGAVVGLVIAGVWNPIPVIFFTGLGCALGYFVPVIFSTFNTYYGRFEQFYAWLLDWVLSHRRLIMGALGVGILLTGFAFRLYLLALCQEDQGYGIGFVMAPEGTSNDVTNKVNKKIASILRTEPDVTAAGIFSGASLDGYGPNRGLFFYGVKNWDERPQKDQSMEAITQRLNQKMAAEIDEARVFVVSLLPFLAMAPALALSSSCSIRAAVRIR